MCDWYDGPTLFETLDAIEQTDRNPLAPVRIPIVDKWCVLVLCIFVSFYPLRKGTYLLHIALHISVLLSMSSWLTMRVQ